MVGGLIPAPTMGQDYPRLGSEIESHVAAHFFDRAKAEAWLKSHTGYARSLADRSSFTQATNTALDSLKTSHTRYYTPDDVEYYGLLAIFGSSLKQSATAYISIGADYADGRFVRSVLAGSPAETAGLKRGDEIVGADGAAFDPIKSFLGRTGQDVVLTIRRAEGGPLSNVTVRPRLIRPDQEWRESQVKSARLIAKNGKTIGYVRMFSGAGDSLRELLEEQLSDRLTSADVLVLDFRDGWGGCNPDFVNLFNSAPPRLTFVERDGNARDFDHQWRKPLVLLINGGTRSGKEVVAHAVKTRKLGTLVGERTAGAVVAGKPFLLSDRSLLFLAVADVRVDGERLEGVGVSPDVTIADPLPYAAGRDLQLEAAIDIAAKAAR